MPKEKNKSKWAKGLSKDDIFEMGKVLGRREMAEFLADECAVSPDIVGWLTETWFDRQKKNEKK